jgi:hypothetical protein
MTARARWPTRAWAAARIRAQRWQLGGASRGQGSGRSRRSARFLTVKLTSAIGAGRLPTTRPAPFTSRLCKSGGGTPAREQLPRYAFRAAYRRARVTSSLHRLGTHVAIEDRHECHVGRVTPNGLRIE